MAGPSAGEGDTDLGVSLVEADEEEQLGQEEAGTQVRVRVGVVVADGAAEQEGDDGQGEAQQGQENAHVADDVQGKVHLPGQKREMQGHRDEVCR